MTTLTMIVSKEKGFYEVAIWSIKSKPKDFMTYSQILISDRPGFLKISSKIKLYGRFNDLKWNKLQKGIDPRFCLTYVRIVYKCSLYKLLHSFISEKGGSLGSATCVPSSLPIPLWGGRSQTTLKMFCPLLTIYLVICDRILLLL